jgi:hypothetical protein
MKQNIKICGWRKFIDRLDRLVEFNPEMTILINVLLLIISLMNVILIVMSK